LVAGVLQEVIALDQVEQRGGLVMEHRLTFENVDEAKRTARSTLFAT
jgi:hypothetical protein